MMATVIFVPFRAVLGSEVVAAWALSLVEVDDLSWEFDNEDLHMVVRRPVVMEAVARLFVEEGGLSRFNVEPCEVARWGLVENPPGVPVLRVELRR